MDDTKLDFSSEMKYLRVIVDKITDNKNHISYSRKKVHHHNYIITKCYFNPLFLTIELFFESVVQ